MAQGEDKAKKIWKEYFEDVCNVNTQKEVAVHMCGFDKFKRGNYIREPIGRAEVEVRVGKLKNGKAVGKDKITGEIIKGGGDRVADWIWRLCNMVFESGVGPEDWRSVVIVPLYKSKGERSECKNCRGISLLIVVGKIYAEILVDRVSRVTGGLIDEEQWCYRVRRGCVDLHTKADRWESTGEKMQSVYGFYRLGEGV